MLVRSLSHTNERVCESQKKRLCEGAYFSASAIRSSEQSTRRLLYSMTARINKNKCFPVFHKDGQDVISEVENKTLNGRECVPGTLPPAPLCSHNGHTRQRTYCTVRAAARAAPLGWPLSASNIVYMHI